MSKIRKKAPTKSVDESMRTQDHMNQLYLAHQIHTLAHLISQQLANSMKSMTPLPVGGAGFMPGFNGPGFNPWPTPSPVAAQAVQQAGSPALIYWYP